MTDSTELKQNIDHWKKLASLQRSISADADSWWNTYSQLCSYYVDINGKEWIVILLPAQLFV